MKGATPQQAKLFAFLVEQAAIGVSPTYDELEDRLGIRRSGIVRIVRALEERGFIRRLRYRARSIEIVDRSEHARGFREGLAEGEDRGWQRGWDACVAWMKAGRPDPDGGVRAPSAKAA